jgi:hypothetical protein
VAGESEDVLPLETVVHAKYRQLWLYIYKASEHDDPGGRVHQSSAHTLQTSPQRDDMVMRAARALGPHQGDLLIVPTEALHPDAACPGH